MRIPKTKARRAVVVGLDVSLKQTGIAVLGPKWDPLNPWRGEVFTTVAGYELPNDAPEIERIKRIDSITKAVQRALDDCRVMLSRDVGLEIAVFVEDYAFGKAQRAQHIGEVTGPVKLSVFRATGRAAIPVSMTHWRKFLIGVGSADGIKDECHRRMRIAGAPMSWKGDELDAFAVANYGRSGLGMPAMRLVGRGEA